MHIRHHTLRVLCLTLAAVAICLAGVGCNDPLFPEDQPRSPFERHLELRGEYRPAKEENAFGGQQPALRDRLQPLGQPWD